MSGIVKHSIHEPLNSNHYGFHAVGNLGMEGIFNGFSFPSRVVSERREFEYEKVLRRMRLFVNNTLCVFDECHRARGRLGEVD